MFYYIIIIVFYKYIAYMVKKQAQKNTAGCWMNEDNVWQT